MSEDKSVLMLNNVNEKRIGRYECRVVDQNGQIVMNSHHLIRLHITRLSHPEATNIPITLPTRGM